MEMDGTSSKRPALATTLVNVKRFAIAAALLTTTLLTSTLLTVRTAHAALNIMPLKDVRAGMHGTGKTVFNGDKIDDFQVEILGVLENTGPRESLILGRLSGGPLEHTGVLQGMSGSPVYIDGKLIGAVAMAFPYAKDPIAGIRPIEEMLSVDSAPQQRAANLRSLAKNADIASLFPTREPVGSGDTRMTEVATPLSLSGFTAGAVEQFAPQMRKLGLEPRQGISTGGAPEDRMGDPARMQPGSMISVELMTGDMSAGADGTVTAIDGDKIYAFGHRFLGVGPADLPFTRSEVITLLANVNTSFKISSGRELMGVISQDRNTAIAGSLGKRAALVPLDISVTGANKRVENYHMHMVNDRYLSPFLVQTAVFSAIDATERAAGVSSIVVHGEISFENRKDPVRLRNIYAGDGGSAMLAATQTAVPLAYLMETGFDQLKVKGVSIRIESFDVKKELSIGQVYLSRKEVKPGETIELMTEFDGENGVQVTRSLKYTVPLGTAAGTLFFTVADGTQTGLAELKQIIAETPQSPEQSISTVGRLRPSDKAYVRVWRAEPAYEVAGEELPDPPPSLALILGSTQTVSQNRNSKVTELVIDAGETMVTGSRTVQVEVKE
jgi:SpoIVB peptidase S55